MQLYFFEASGVGENRQRRLAVLVSVFIAGVRITNNGQKAMDVGEKEEDQQRRKRQPNVGCSYSSPQTG